MRTILKNISEETTDCQRVQTNHFVLMNPQSWMYPQCFDQQSHLITADFIWSNEMMMEIGHLTIVVHILAQRGTYRRNSMNHV